jgi:hypothetical protein
VGPVDEAGKVASGAIEALRSQPLVLALVLLQAVVLAAVLYSSIHRQGAIDRQFAHVFGLLQACLKSGNLPVPELRG